MTPEAGASRPYWPSLDGMRAVAIVAVMVFHASIFTLPGGGTGVDVFFVLSGFLITSLLLRERARFERVGLGRFYGRRALRLLPAVYVVVAVVLVITHFAPSLGNQHGQAVSTLLYYANVRYSQHKPMGMFAPMWSLSMEEQFYLLWPPVLALLLFLGVRRRRLLAGTALTFVLLAGWHWLAGATGWADRHALLYRPDLRADGLMLGCTIGIWLSSPPRFSRRAIRCLRATGVCGVAVLALAFWKPQWVSEPTRYTLLITIVTLATGAVLVTQLVAPMRVLTAVLTARYVRWLGRISYSLYLVHAPILVIIVLEMRTLPRPVQLTLFAVASLAAACLLHYRVERPFLRLKDRRMQPEPEAHETTVAIARGSSRSSG